MESFSCSSTISALAAACFSKVGGRFPDKESFYKFHEKMQKFLPEYIEKIAAEQRVICANTFLERWEAEDLPEYKKRQLRTAIIFSKPPKYN